MDPKWARPWFAATALAVLTGVIIQVFVSANNQHGLFPTAAGRVFNVFCYFTVQSNLIVGVTSLLLALRLERSSTVFRVFRLIGVVGITVTGIVYHVALAHLLDLDSWALAADQILHTVVPILTVAGWLVFGPRRLTSARVAKLTALFPVCWFLFTLVRGEIVDFYPYPFVDVAKLGYVKVLVNSVWVALLFVGLAAGAAALDTLLVRLRPASTTPT